MRRGDKMDDEQKLDRYNYSVYVIQELLRLDIENMVDDDSKFAGYLQGRAYTYLEVLRTLTDDEKWMVNLEGARELLREKQMKLIVNVEGLRVVVIAENEIELNFDNSDAMNSYLVTLIWTEVEFE